MLTDEKKNMDNHEKQLVEPVDFPIINGDINEEKSS
jgi:hypothetical protein